jgi:hypothetical protein
MPTNPEPVTVADVVRRAVEICDPADTDPALGDLLVQFEDADEPVTTVENLEERLALAAEGVDVGLESPAVSVAVSTALYLAFRRDELDDDPHDVLRLAARAEWQGDPPDAVAAWLADRGVKV